METVYVYGTLRTGAETFQGDLKGRMYDMGGFPALILDDVEGDEIVYEVRQVDAQGLDQFDWYEGYNPSNPSNSYYLRKRFKDGWIYEFNHPFRLNEEDRILSGDWFNA